MPFVIDASVALAWAFGEQDARAAVAWARMSAEAVKAPGLWWYELRNVLLVGERRGRLSEQQTGRFLRELAHSAVTLDHSPDEMTVLALARHHRLTIYDAAYLELALREKLDLATLDAALVAAARSEGVAVIGA